VGQESSSQTCRDARGEQTPAGTQAKDFADAFDDETCMDSRPHKRRAAEKCDELAPPHGGLTPRPGSRRTITGLEWVGGVHRNKKGRPMSALGHLRQI